MNRIRIADPDRLAAAADRIVRDTVPPVALGLGVLYALLAVAHELALPEGYRTLMVVMAAATSVALLAIHTGARRLRLPAGSGHPAMGGILVLVLANSVVHLRLSGEIIQTTNLMLLAVACGCVLLNPAWFWAVLGVATAAGAWAAADAGPVGWRLHFVIGYATCLAISAVFRWIRWRSVCRYEAALTELESTAAGLRQATLAAESGNQAKSEFLDSMSRELRGPLADLVGLTDQVLAAAPPAPLREPLHQIRDRAAAAMAVVADLLELADFDPAGRAPTLEEADLRQILRAQCERHGQRAREKGLEFRIQIDPAVPARARVDVRRTRQMLACLLGNAVRFTLRGRIDVEATATPRPQGGWQVRVGVRDTGIGFSEGDRSRMFDPLSHRDEVHARTGGGGGFSLAIARQNAESLGGQLDGFGAPGKGSAFWLELPVDPPRAATTQPDPPPAAPDTAPAPVAPPGEPAVLRLLVAGPDTVGGQYLTRLLESLGHRVVRPRPDDADAAPETARCDAVLLELPGADPDSLARLAGMRNRRAPGGMPVVVVVPTAAAAGDRAAWTAAGAAACLVQPVRPTELRLVLDRIRAGVSGPGPGEPNR